MSERHRDDDDDAFERAMAGVVRLPSDPRGHIERVVQVPATRPGDEPVAAADEAPDDYVVDGVDRRELRKLRGGNYTVRARLDLHGVRAADAPQTVRLFVDNSRRARHRCVCIVHGRGLNSPQGVPVLKGIVRAELMRSRSVLAFAPAPRVDGGSGALYVLLRR